MRVLRQVRSGLPDGGGPGKGVQQRRVHPLRRLRTKLPRQRHPYGVQTGAGKEEKRKHDHRISRDFPGFLFWKAVFSRDKNVHITLMQLPDKLEFGG